MTNSSSANYVDSRGTMGKASHGEIDIPTLKATSNIVFDQN